MPNPVIYSTRYWLNGLCLPMARETWVQSQVESYQRLKKWYLMPSCLTLSVIRYGSKVKWVNPGKGVVPFPTIWCSSLRVTDDYGHQLYFSFILHIPQRSRTGASLDGLVSYPGHSLEKEGSYFSAEMQSVYSTDPAVTGLYYMFEKFAMFNPNVHEMATYLL